MASLPEMETIALLADDLTGALDGGSPFASAGLKTRLVLRGGCKPETADTDIQVVVSSSDSRLLDSKEARARMRNCMSEWSPLAPTLLIKKMDSLLRGHYGAEVHEMLSLSNRSAALVCPALPRMGRHVRAGVLVVAGRQVADGESFSGEPSRGLRAELEQYFPSNRIEFFANPPGPGRILPQVAVLDAMSEADLDHAVDTFWPLRDRVLWVGSSGLTRAIARRMTASLPPSSVATTGATFPLLLVIGSRTPVTRNQLATLRSALRLADAGLSDRDGPQCLSGRDVTVLASPEHPVDPDETGRRLASAATDQLSADLYRTIAVIGGETLHALMDRLQPVRVDVLGTAGAGFEAARLCMIWGTTITLLSRSGSFGANDDLVTLCTPGSATIDASRQNRRNDHDA